MHRLIKYLKPFWFSLLLVAGLLVAQAQCELTLPQMMSEIVTNGIQNGGIEDAVPQEVRAETMDKMLLFMDEEERSLVLEHYQLSQTGLESYVLQPVDESTRKQLDAVVGRSLVMVQALSQPALLEKLALPEQTDLFEWIKENPEWVTHLDALLEEQGMSKSTIEAAALMAVQAEYAALDWDIGALQLRYIAVAGLKMLIVAFAGMVCAIAVGFLSSRIAAGLSRNLRSQVFNQVEQFSTTEMNRFSTASLITRTTNDIQQVQLVMTMMLRIVVYAPIIGLGAMGKVYQTNAKMLWIIVLVLAIVLIVLLTTFALTMPQFKKIQKLIDRINLVMREFLSGMPVIRAFNTEKQEEQRFDQANRQMTKVNLFVNRVMASVMPMMTFLMSSVSVLIVWIGARYIDMGTLQIGDMMAFMQYSMQILMSFIMIAVIAIMLPQGSVSAQRILEVLDAPLSICDPEDPAEFDPMQKGKVVFDSVDFRYPGAEEDVLKGISFTALPKKTTAFIGSTGSGKSTLINLIPRFFDVTSGSITVDGVDIRQVSQHDLREKIGYVPQKGILFSGDIESNLRYAKENAEDSDIERAIEVSQSKEFITAKPEGLKTPIAQGGTNVSGGQKQRLSIARALTKNPEIYIFDDSFSALDFKTDAALREALNRMIAETKSTVLVVAQRISTIMHADQIIVMDQGKIVGIGTHEKLMDCCEVYRQIAYSQLSKEELNHDESK